MAATPEPTLSQTTTSRISMSDIPTPTTGTLHYATGLSSSGHSRELDQHLRAELDRVTILNQGLGQQADVLLRRDMELQVHIATTTSILDSILATPTNCLALPAELNLSYHQVDEWMSLTIFRLCSRFPNGVSDVHQVVAYCESLLTLEPELYHWSREYMKFLDDPTTRAIDKTPSTYLVLLFEKAQEVLQRGRMQRQPNVHPPIAATTNIPPPPSAPTPLP